MRLSGCRANWNFFTAPTKAHRGRIRELSRSKAVLCCHDPIEDRRWLRVALHEPTQPGQHGAPLTRVTFARVIDHYEMIDLWEDDSLTLYRHVLEWIEPLESEWVQRLTPDLWDVCPCSNLIQKSAALASPLCGLCTLRVALAQA